MISRKLQIRELGSLEGIWIHTHFVTPWYVEITRIYNWKYFTRTMYDLLCNFDRSGKGSSMWRGVFSLCQSFIQCHVWEWNLCFYYLVVWESADCKPAPRVYVPTRLSPHSLLQSSRLRWHLIIQACSQAANWKSGWITGSLIPLISHFLGIFLFS